MKGFFCTLGMFILDDIEFRDNTVKKNVIGGAGTYAVLGARMHMETPINANKKAPIGWIIDCGRDFEINMYELINTWNTNVLFRKDEKRLTTRGWNSYNENENRLFKYLTPKKRIYPDDLFENNIIPKEFFVENSTIIVHLISSPNRAVESIVRIEELYKKLKLKYNFKFLYVWEPVPDLCVTSEYDNVKSILNYIPDCSELIITPNAKEAASLYGENEPMDIDSVENISYRLFEDIITNTKKIENRNNLKGVLIRAGALGCVIVNKKLDEDKINIQQLDPFYGKNEQNKVIDPTGCGNAFVGGFAAGWLESDGDIRTASIYGTVSSSFVLEQVGLPSVTFTDGEKWNSCVVRDRVRLMKGRFS